MLQKVIRGYESTSYQGPGTRFMCDVTDNNKKGHGGHLEFNFKFKPVVETLREEMSVKISLSFVLVRFKTCCDLSQL